MEFKKFNLAVLYVEDDPQTKEEVGEILRRRVKTLYFAENGQTGLEMYKQYQPDLVITDLRMPICDGLKMSREIKSLERNAHIIVTTAYSDANFVIDSIDIGINHYVLKPINRDKLIAAIQSCANIIDMEERQKQQEDSLRKGYDELETRVAERTAELMEANQKLQQEIVVRERVERALHESNSDLKTVIKETVLALAATVQVTDFYTAEHQQQVATLATKIAKEMGLSEEQIDGILVAAMLHDIGKIYVPSQILNKRTTLTEIEFALIKTHPQVGHDIIQKIPFAWPVAKAVLQHHERMNGTGYPAGITGKDIQIEARIIAVADVFDAITAYRPYRPALGTDAAIAEISQKKGIAYDLDVVNACLKVISY